MAVDVSKIPNNNKFDPVREAILSLKAEIEDTGAAIGNGTLTIGTSGTLSGNTTFTANQTGNSTITIGIDDSDYVSLSDTGTQTLSGSLSLVNTTLSGYLRGPATFVIDPAAHGDDTGTVVIAGNLQVDGTTTTINSTTLTVDDKNIVLASGAANATAANGAGITIDVGTNDPVITNPTILYDSSNDTWNFNKWVYASKFVGDVTGNADTASALETARNIALDGDVTGNADFDGSGDITITTVVANDSHTHDGRYYTETESDNRFVNVDGDTMTGNLNFSDSAEGITWTMNTDGASIKFYNTGDADTDSRLEFQTTDNNNEYFRWTHKPSGGTTYELMRLTGDGSGGTLDISGALDINGSTVITSGRSLDVISATVKGSLNLTTAGAELQIGGVEVIDASRNITANSLTTDSISGGTINIDASTRLNLQHNGSTKAYVDSSGFNIIDAELDLSSVAGISLTDSSSSTDSYFHANVDYDAGLYTVTSNARYGADYIQVDGLDSREDVSFTISPKDIGDPDPHAYLYIGGDNSITAPNTLVDWHTIEMNALLVKLNANLNIQTGGLLVGGTTVIDSSRNISAVYGTFSSNISAAHASFSGDININSGYPRINLNDVNSEDDWAIINADGTLEFYNVDDNVRALQIDSDNNSVFNGNITANSFIKSGGTSSQFLKADGSVDSNTYLTGESDTLQSVTSRGNSTNTYITSSADTSSQTYGNFTASGTEDWYMFALGTRGASAGAYGIGLKNDITDRTLSLHIPNHAAYGSTGAVPKIGFYSNGAVELFAVQSDSGNTSVRGNLAIGSHLDLSSTLYTRGNLEVLNAAGTGWYQWATRSNGKYDLNIGSLSVGGNATFVNNITVSSGNTTGNGIILADDGDMVDLNDSWLSMRFTRGVRIYSENKGGTVSAQIGNGSIASAYTYFTTNVGIGTTSPTKKLDVDGAIRTRNSFNVSDGTTQIGGLFPYKVITGAGTDNSLALFTETGLDLHFMTNGSVSSKMIINSSGNVGIGTTSPGYKLDVQGSMLATSSVRMATSTDATVTIGDYHHSSGSSSDTKLILAGKNLESGGTYYGDYGQLLFRASSNYTGSARQWLVTNALDAYKFSIIMGDSGQALPTIGTAGGVSNGTPVLTITDAAYVGIGTTSPSEKLQVAEDGGVFSVNPTAGGVDLHSNGGFAPHYQTNFDWYTGAMGSGTFRMRLTSSGNLGIGTTSPDEKLHVQGNLRVGTGDSNNQQIQINYVNNSSGYGAIRFLQQGTNHQTIHSFCENWQGGNVFASGGAININGQYGVTIGTWPDPDVVIASGGTTYFRNNVGIGVTSPSERLEVNGTIKLGGYSYIGEDLSDLDSLTIACDHTESIHFAHKNGSTYTTKMILNSSGNVGIGTYSPNSRLEVAGAITAVGGNLSTNATLYCNKGASDTIQAGSSVYLDGGSGSSYTQLQQGVGRFTIWGFNGSWGEKMTIRHSDGNVGIGVTAPGDKLEVNGNVRGSRFISTSNMVAFTGSGLSSDGYPYARIVEAWGVSMAPPDPRWAPNVSGASFLVGAISGGANYGVGNIRATGDVIAFASDRRLKTNIKPIENALDRVLKLNGVYYNWDLELCNKWDFHPTDKVESGVIAQEVQEVFPEVVQRAPFDCTGDEEGNIVSKSGEDYLTVKYEKLVPLLIEAIKELKDEVNELKARLDA